VTPGGEGAGGSGPALAKEYLGRLDRGEAPFELLSADAEVSYPKWGTARGHEQIRSLYGDLGRYFRRFRHHAEDAVVVDGGETVVATGFSSGEARSGGSWTADDEWGRWCAVFDLADGRIRRVVVYADPDFAQEDRSRYPWDAFSRKLG
jgi:ketosteroid isomerase-like protein